MIQPRIPAATASQFASGLRLNCETVLKSRFARGVAFDEMARRI